VVLAAAALALVAEGEAFAQESASFVMSRVTLSATGAVSSSAHFDTRVTFGQEVPVGAASICNDGYHQSAGFWSLLGDQPVPTLLVATADAMTPGGVILSWTGSATEFDVYRADAPDSVVDPMNLSQTVFVCTTSDSPSFEPIIYYMVAPGGP